MQAIRKTSTAHRHDAMTTTRRDFSALRKDHPVFFWGMLFLSLLLLSGAAIIAVRIPAYVEAKKELNERMTAEERATRDRLLASQARRSEMAVALFQREMRLKALQEKKLHLAIILEDSALELRHGPATLRRAKIQIGPDSTIRAPGGQTWRFVRPVGERTIAEKETSPDYVVPEWVYLGRGEPVPTEEARTVEGGLGRYVIRLNDGTEIYSKPKEGPLADEVKPAAFMASERDLVAIFDAVRKDAPVYIY